MSQWTRGQGSHMVSDGRMSRPRGLGSTLASVGSSVTAAAQQSVEASHVCSNWRAYRCYSFVYLFILFISTRCSGFRTHCLWWKFQIVVLFYLEATNSSSGSFPWRSFYNSDWLTETIRLVLKCLCILNVDLKQVCHNIKVPCIRQSVAFNSCVLQWPLDFFIFF